MRVRVPQGAEGAFESMLVGIRIPVEIVEIDFDCGGIGMRRRERERRPICIFVSI